jgi:hypothetical protein
MNALPHPRIGEWYKNPRGDSFEIVARDDDEETLELQYYDGTIEELDRETWEILNPEPIEPPEDWSGSMDVSGEDSCGSDIWSETHDWMDTLDQMEKDLI